MTSWRTLPALARRLCAAFVLTTVIPGLTACSSITDLGPRGDAHFYLDRTWMMDYPRLEFTPVPLDARRSYVLKATNLEVWGYQNFNLAVYDKGGGTAQPSANGKPPVIRIRVVTGKGRTFITDTVGSKTKPWLEWSGKRRDPILKSVVSAAPRSDPMLSTPENWTSFTVIVEVLEPSSSPGQFLHISAP